MYSIQKQNLHKLFAAIASHIGLYVPALQHGVVNFCKWHDQLEIDLETHKTVVPPKQFFMPAYESLYLTRTTHKGLQVEQQEVDNTPFAIFGVRECDAAGIEVLDSVYISNPTDYYYAQRRSAATIILNLCQQANATCFCRTFENSSTQVADILTWVKNDTMHWQAQTQKGQDLTAAVAHIFESTQTAQQAHPTYDTWRLNTSGLDISQILQIFEHPAWDELYRTCLACGSCTYVCPTCQCYDISSFSTGHNVVHHRCQDSCMYKNFTQMAHGNPRATHKERFRQRFMHKLVYHPQAHGGAFGCVGCGRCVASCPANISISKVANALAGGKSNV